MRPVITTLLATVALAVAGCPPQEATQQPPGVCQSAGTQCDLGEGQLGVCTAGPLAPDAAPVYHCQPQH